jgi:lipid-A-disaccharide synthase
MKYYIIAGEASGDLHGANMMKALCQMDTDAEMRIWGGDLMEKAGGTLVKHYRDLAFMGFVEVAKNIRTILRNIRFCKEDIDAFQPDALILIDYPGFNLRIAKWAKAQGYKVYYYISPQVWAWNSKRIHGMKQSIDKLFVILPFEQDFFKKYGMEVDFVGHPLMDIIDQHPRKSDFKKENKLNDRPIIALLPGSRKQEISRMLGIMLKVAPRFSQCQFVIAGAPAIDASFYQSILEAFEKEHPDMLCTLVKNQTYDLLQHATAALVTSGTATLETALFGVPQVVCYTGNRISYHIARRLINVKYISLVNLIIDQPLIKELIQDELSLDNLEKELEKLLTPQYSSELKNGYQKLRSVLGAPGASKRVAELIFEDLQL